MAATSFVCQDYLQAGPGPVPSGPTPQPAVRQRFGCPPPPSPPLEPLSNVLSPVLVTASCPRLGLAAPSFVRWWAPGCEVDFQIGLDFFVQPFIGLKPQLPAPPGGPSAPGWLSGFVSTVITTGKSCISSSPRSTEALPSASTVLMSVRIVTPVLFES